MRKAKSSFYDDNSYNKKYIFNNSFKHSLSKGLNVPRKIRLMEFDISSSLNKTFGKGNSSTNINNRAIIRHKSNLKKSFIKNCLMNDSFSNVFEKNNSNARIDTAKIYLGNLYYYDYKQASNISLKDKKTIENNRYWLLNSNNFTIYPFTKKKYNKINSHYSTTTVTTRNNVIENKNDPKFNTKRHFLNKVYLTMNNENKTNNINLKKEKKNHFINKNSNKNSPIKLNKKLNIYPCKQNNFKNNDKNPKIVRNLKSASTINHNFNIIERVKSEKNRKQIKIAKKMINNLLIEINDRNSNLKTEIKNNKLDLAKFNNFTPKLKLGYSIKPMIELNREEKLLSKKMKEVKIKNDNKKIGLISFKNPKGVLNLHKKLYKERKNIKNLLKNSYILYKEYISINRIKNEIA